MNTTRKRNYPWGSEKVGPVIMKYINTLSNSSRVNARNRLSWIFERIPFFILENFPVEKCIQLIEGSPWRKQQKEAFFHELKGLFEFLEIDLPMNPQFSEKTQIYEDPEDPNKGAIVNYLNSLNSPGTKSRERRKIDFDLKYLYENFGIRPILEYDANQIKQLFIHINQKPILKDAKERFRTALNNLIKSKIKIFRAENHIIPRDYPYIFSDEFYEFSEGSKTRIEKHWLEANQLIEFYQEVKGKNPQHYVIFRVFLSSCRVGGLVHILVKNIDFEKRIFETQEKPTKKSSGWNTYHFPKSLVPEIRAYILQKNLGPDDLLFSYSEETILRFLKKYRPWGCHDFRRSILRLWRKAKMDPIDRSFLSNHDVPGDLRTDAIYTGDNSIEYLRSVFDSYFELLFKGRL